jgi:Ni/Co efflux regulator RcnB
MKKILMLAGLGALLATSPALAKGNGHGHGHSQMAHDRDGRDNDRRDSNDWRRDGGNTRWDAHRAAYSGDGRGYWDNGRYYRDGRMYGTSCPRGLAKKNNGCLPPGHAKARWSVGQRLPESYRNSYIPQAYRDRYNDGTYRYADGYVYRVDPRTYAIQQIIAAVLR